MPCCDGSSDVSRFQRQTFKEVVSDDALVERGREQLTVQEQKARDGTLWKPIRLTPTERLKAQLSACDKQIAKLAEQRQAMADELQAELIADFLKRKGINPWGFEPWGKPHESDDRKRQPVGRGLPVRRKNRR